MELKYDSKYNVFYMDMTYEEYINSGMLSKQVGMAYDKIKRIWWTRNWRVAEKIIQHCDYNTDIITRIEDAKLLEESKIRDSAKTTTDFEPPAPDNKQYFPYQKAGIEHIVTHRNTLLGDEMGLGKTIEAIGTLNFSKPENVLILCPASLKLNWLNEIKKWLTIQYNVYSDDDIYMDMKKPYIYVTNYDRLSKYENKLLNIKWEMAFLDEGHYIKNSKSKRTKIALKLGKNIQRKILMTGTPVLNRPQELYTLLKFLDHPFGNNYRAFMNKFVVADSFGNAVEYRNLDYLDRTLRRDIMIRRKKEDVLKDLPDKTETVLTLDSSLLPAELRAQNQEIVDKYNEQKAELIGLKEQLKLAESEEVKKSLKEQIQNLQKGAFGTIGVMAKIRHETALHKLKYSKEIIDNILDSEDQLIIYAHHRDVIEQLLKMYPESRAIYGGMSNKEKQKNIDDFNNKEYRIIVLSIKAAGLGITLTSAHVGLFLELDWTPSNIHQAEDRMHRIGQRENVSIYMLVFDKSIDSYIANMIVEKQDIIDSSIEFPEDSE